jgi:hypothetical protein
MKYFIADSFDFKSVRLSPAMTYVAIDNVSRPEENDDQVVSGGHEHHAERRKKQ